jgi:hypothetical protein
MSGAENIVMLGDTLKTFTVPDFRDSDKKRKLSFDRTPIRYDTGVVTDMELEMAESRIFGNSRGRSNSIVNEAESADLPRKKTQKPDSPRKSSERRSSPVRERRGSIAKGRTPSAQSLIQFEQLESGAFQENKIEPVDETPRDTIQPVITYESFLPCDDEENEFTHIIEPLNNNNNNSDVSDLSASEVSPQQGDDGISTLESIGHSQYNGILYTMEQRKTWAFGRQLRGFSRKDLNIVGIARLDDIEVIYKVPRLPAFTIFAEYRVCKALSETLPSIKHFSRTLFITKMALRCDKRNLALASYPNGATNEPWRTCDVLVQKFIPGVSLALAVETNPSYRKLFSAIYQTLGVLWTAQQWLGYNHNDLHSNNILLKPLKDKKVFHLFDALGDQGKPFAVYSHGFKVVIIDNEFAHTCTVDGNPLDSFMGHICRSYDPTSFDKSIDVLRVLIGTFGYYDQKHANPFMRKLANTLIEKVNGYGQGGITDDGIFVPSDDPIFKSISQHYSEFKDTEKEFIQRSLYHIIGHLGHRIKLPLEKKVEVADSTHLLNIIKLLFALKCSQDEYRMRVLHELVSSKDPNAVRSVMEQLKIGIDNFSMWYNKIQNEIEACLPHLETALYFTTLENREKRRRQHEEEFTPEKMIGWLSSKYTLHHPVERGSTVYWMTKSKRYKVSLNKIPEPMLDYVNATKDMFEFSKRLKEVTQRAYQLQTD